MKMSFLSERQRPFLCVLLFLFFKSLIGDWSSGVWCVGLLPQHVACAPLQDRHLAADRRQLSSVTAQCHVAAASPPQTHTGGVVCDSGRWGDAVVRCCSARLFVKPLGGIFFFFLSFFSLEKWHSCGVLRVIHVAENTVFRKKWLSRTTVSFSHHFYLSDSHLWDVSCNRGK